LSYANWKLSNGARLSGSDLVLPNTNSTAVSPALDIPKGQTMQFKLTYKNTGYPPITIRMGSIINGKGGQGGVSAWAPSTGVEGVVSHTISTSGSLQIVLTRDVHTPGKVGVATLRPLEISPFSPENVNASPKTPFAHSGSRLHIAQDGSTTVDDKPFVIKGMYTSQARADWNDYSKVGFNMAMWISSVRQLNLASDAGMLGLFSAAPYLWHKGWAFGDVALMYKNLETILNSKNGKDLVGIYFDNEAYDQWADVKKGLLGLKALYPHLPVYVLQGNQGLAAAYAQEGMQDLTGSYVGSFNTGGAGNSSGAGAVHSMWESPLQTTPVTIGQCNGDTVKHLQSNIVAASAGLISGWAHWSDRPTHDVTKAPFWAQMKSLNAQFDAAVASREPQEPIVVPEPPVVIVTPKPPVDPAPVVTPVPIVPVVPAPVVLPISVQELTLPSGERVRITIESI